jgi:hypothetical protein
VLEDKKRELRELLCGLGAREITHQTSHKGTIRFKGTIEFSLSLFACGGTQSYI